MILFCCIMCSHAFPYDFKFISAQSWSGHLRCFSGVSSFSHKAVWTKEKPFIHWGLPRQPHRWRWQDRSRRVRSSSWRRCQRSRSFSMEEWHINWTSHKGPDWLYELCSRHRITGREPECIHPPAGLKQHTPGETRCSAGEHSPLQASTDANIEKTIFGWHLKNDNRRLSVTP